MPTKIQEIKKKIALLAAELHREFHTEYAEWNPKFPWILVHVLPREQRIGSLWVPGDTKNQNKVTLEGVVVKLWKADHLNIKSELAIGDHVCFPHYCGQPFSNASDQEFRLVKECFPNYINSSDIIDSGSIFLKLEYSDKTIENELLKDIKLLRKSNETDKEFLDRLRKNFVIYPNHSRTLSGK